MKKAYAISAAIYKHHNGDCSNGGISSRFSEILLLCDEGCIEVDLENPPENLCIVVERELFGKRHDYIAPYVSKTDGKWYMYGGSIVYGSDSRCPDEPLKLFDRTE